MSLLARRRLRAPPDDGAALIDPPPSQFAAHIKRNQALLATSPVCILDKPLATFAHLARVELLEAAMHFRTLARPTSWVPAAMQAAPFVLTGHQPELFHPGVWFKNFLLSTAAAQAQAVPINLVIDSDVVRSAAIRVPAGRKEAARVEQLAFDAPGEGMPYEERPIYDPRLFESFGARCAAMLAESGLYGAGSQRLVVKELWRAAAPDAQQRGANARLGDVLALARHWLEWEYGLRTLEAPLSAVARSRSFRRFALHLLIHLPRLREIYNASLYEYRQVNRIRSQSHPAPRLEADGEWLEAPLLLWTTDNSRRRYPFVRRQRDSLVITDREHVSLSLDLAEGSAADDALEQLAAAEARGIKLRPRALITTMYARLVLSDLFLHGIGGAKYDELTDLIIRRFFGAEPPAYVTATATFRLPLERPDVTAQDVRYCAQRIRELRYRPESFVHDPLVARAGALPAALAAYAAEKREFLDRNDLRHCSQDVYDRLDRLNVAMYQLLRPVETEMQAAQQRLAEQFQQTRLLGSREFSFVLFPSEILPARLLDLCRVSS